MNSAKTHTIQEWKINKQFKSLCEKHKVHLSHDVRITDLLPSVERHLSVEDYRFLLHSGFNYSVASLNSPPLFLIDFSNPIHYRENCRRNDEILDSLCRRFELPLLRINADHLCRPLQHLQLISRFMETWFSKGALPEKPEGGRRHCETEENEAAEHYDFLWLPSKLRMINIFRETGERFHTDFSLFLGKDRKKIFHGIGWLQLSEENGVFTHAILRNHGFPVSEAGLLTGILRFQVFEKLYTCHTGTGRPLPMETIEKSVRLFKEKLEPLSFNAPSLSRPAEGIRPFSSDSC